MAPKISDMQVQMDSARAKMTKDIVKMIADPNTESGRAMKRVKEVITSDNLYEARKKLEPRHPDLRKKNGLAPYMDKIKKQGEDFPVTGIKTHVHGEDGGHATLFSESPEEHKRLHQANFFLNKEKKTFVDHFYTAQERNMELAYFDTLNEQINFGEKVAFNEKNPEIESVFISGLRTGRGWKWVKQNGENLEYPIMTYSIWNKGEPNNSGNRENVIQLYKNGKWNDIAHTAKLPALYRIKTDSVEPFSQIEPFSSIEESSLIEGFSSNEAANRLQEWALTLDLHLSTADDHCSKNLDDQSVPELASCYCPSTFEYFKQYKTYFSKLNTNYNNLVETIRNSLSVLNTKRQQLDRIKRKTNIYSQNSLIDNKKNLYSQENLKTYSKIYYVALIIYYIGLVVSLILSKFFPKKLYKNIRILLLVILYIILPFILGKIVNFLYIKIINFLEKNNLRDDIISYTDIVNDYESNNSQYHPEL